MRSVSFLLKPNLAATFRHSLTAKATSFAISSAQGFSIRKSSITESAKSKDAVGSSKSRDLIFNVFYNYHYKP
jgi:hypothetical protein